MKLRDILFLLFLLVSGGFVLQRYVSYPAHLEQSGAAPSFSASRAYEHVQMITRQPRRMHTPYYVHVREYVINELSRHGIRAELQRTSSHEPRLPTFCSSVENIIARIEGTSGSGNAILFVAHLDSEPFGSPGAADNAGSVACLIELASVVKSLPALPNDLLFLFSVPEEPGMQGVTAFITEHPLAHTVKVVFNCDGLGSGRLVLQAVSEKNDRLIREYGRAIPTTLAFSFVTAAEPFPPRDVSVFKYAGYPAFDLATYFTGSRLWHSRLDGIHLISSSSLQENGEALLALANRFGMIDLNEQDTAEVIFHNMLGLFIVHYPKGLIVPVVIVLSLLSLCLLGYLVQRSKCGAKGILKVVGVLMIGCAVATGSVRLLWYLITGLHPLYQFLNNDAAYNRILFYLGFVLLSFLSVVGVVAIWFRKKSEDAVGIAAGALTFLTMVNMFAAVMFPDLSALLSWILVSLQLLLIGRLILQEGSWVYLGAALIYSFVVFVVFTPMLMAQCLSADGDPLRYASAILASVALLPVLYKRARVSQRFVMTLLGGVCGLLLVIPLTHGFSVDRPRVTFVSCISVADHDRTFWYTKNLFGASIDEYSKQFIADGQPVESIRTYLPDYIGDHPGYFTEIHGVSLTPPRMEILRDSIASGYRHIDLRIRSERNAWEVSVFRHPTVRIIDYAVEGVPCKPFFGLERGTIDTTVLCSYRNLKPDGLRLSVVVVAGEHVILKVRDRSFGIPLSQGMRPMTESMIPRIDYGANTTTVLKTFEF